MKVLKKIKKILLGFICAIFLCFAIFLSILLLNRNDYGVTQFDDTSLVIIGGRVSSQVYKKGDLVLVKSKELTDIKKGDEVFVYKLDGHGAVNLVIGNVDSVYEEGISLINGGGYSTKFIAGEPIKTYNKLGYFLSIIGSKWGFLFIILVPLFFIFIYQIYALIIEIRYGKDEFSEETSTEKEEPKEKPKTIRKKEAKEKPKPSKKEDSD